MNLRSLLMTLMVVLFTGAPSLLGAPIHDGEPEWLDGTQVDQGIYVKIHHPRVIRNLRSFKVGLAVCNVDGDRDAIVREIRCDLGADRGPVVRRPDHALPSRRSAYHEYKTVRKALEQLSEAGDRDVERIEGLVRRRVDSMFQVAQGGFVDAYDVDQDWVDAEAISYRMTIEIDVEQAGVIRTLRKPVVIPLQDPLPNGTGPMRRVHYSASTGSWWVLPTEPGDELPGSGSQWYAGDQHLHTVYSVDAFLLHQNLFNAGWYALAADIYGLDWIVTTDHSNIHFSLFGYEWYTEDQFELSVQQTGDYREATGFQSYAGQELGLGAQGFFNEPSHFLAYPKEVDSMGYLENPSSGMITGHLNCEPEQVILDRVTAAGGMGFVAHPFVGSFLFYEGWNFSNGATGHAGFEIWCAEDGTFQDTDEQALVKWLELLGDIPAPSGGQLSERPGFPTRFPVGIGNSDAHTIGAIGNTFTYSRLYQLDRVGIMNGLTDGRCIASNGPLAFGTINGAGPGEVAVRVVDGENTIELTLQSTAEFGPVGDYEIRILVDGVPRVVIPPSGMPGDSVVFEVDDLVLSPQDSYVNVFAASAVGIPQCYANPIWLQFD